jgi:hypothetical protein
LLLVKKSKKNCERKRKSVKERAKKEEKRNKERKKGVFKVARGCVADLILKVSCSYMKLVLILDSNIYILFGWFVALGYSTIASLEKPPIAPQKFVTEALDSYPFNRLITSLVTPLSTHSWSLRTSKNLGKQEVML